MSAKLNCFTAYDVRGRVPDELNPEIARLIGRAFAERFNLKKVVIGRDMRLSSPEIMKALSETLLSLGVNVLDIGLAGTEEVYHAVFSGEDKGVDGGIMVTASHNPADYNGMKLVQLGARPVSRNTGLRDIEEMAASYPLPRVKDLAQTTAGRYEQCHDKSSYIRHLLTYVQPERLKSLRLVVNAGNGCAGPVIDELEKHLPFTFIKLNHIPDGTFPNGVPNPLLPEKREATARAVRENGADLGIAWDGDFDRCFLYDETGRFIEGYYIVGLLSQAMLRKYPEAVILHDPRLIWNTRHIVAREGGLPVMTRTGHAFIKEKMREVDAAYGGEMSAHHYFRDFGYCDSGMIPWLLVCQLLCDSGQKLSAMMNECIESFPVSGEINSTVKDPDKVINGIREKYSDGKTDFTDGLSVEYHLYRFNLRKSNTEPVLRLNVETRRDRDLLKQKTAELLAFIREGL